MSHHDNVIDIHRPVRFTIDGRTYQTTTRRQPAAGLLLLAGHDPNRYDLGELRDDRRRPVRYQTTDIVRIHDGTRLVPAEPGRRGVADPASSSMCRYWKGCFDMMKPTYDVRAWREQGWWLARVVAASDGADTTPLDAHTHARSLARIEQMARDLVATILDADEDSFDVELEYVLPDDVEPLVYEAIGARTWLDAAQELWQEHSAVAVRALAEQGFSPPETAKLLGLPDQLVDQLLGQRAM